MSRRWICQLVGLAVVGVAAVGVVPPAGPGAPAVSAAPGELGPGGEFHASEVVRIFDSRDPAKDPNPGAKTTGQPFDVKVVGEGDVPDDQSVVLAAFVTVTVIDPTAPGYVEAYPTGFRAANPTSLINHQANMNVPNMAVLGLGNDGSITLRLETPGAPTGSAHFAVDLLGWISKSAYVDGDDTGSRLKAVEPFRPFDTRASTPIGPGETREMQVRGTGVIPDDADVTAVLVNVTGINDLAGSRSTFVSALTESLPPGVPPTTSTTNVGKGYIKANLAVVPVGSDGKIRFYNSVGQIHLAVDVFGYFEKGADEGTYDGRIIPMERPFRAFDTRQPLHGSLPLGFASFENWSFRCMAGDGSTPDTDGDGEREPVGHQTALIGNLTGTLFDRIRPDLPDRTFLSMFPAPEVPLTDPPGISNINVFEGMDVPNMSLLTYGSADPDGPGGLDIDDYMVQAYNDQGTIHYIMDVYALVLGDGDPPDPTDCDTA